MLKKIVAIIVLFTSLCSMNNAAESKGLEYPRIKWEAIQTEKEIDKLLRFYQTCHRRVTLDTEASALWKGCVNQDHRSCSELHRYIEKKRKEYNDIFKELEANNKLLSEFLGDNTLNKEEKLAILIPLQRKAKELSDAIDQISIKAKQNEKKYLCTFTVGPFGGSAVEKKTITMTRAEWNYIINVMVDTSCERRGWALGTIDNKLVEFVDLYGCEGCSWWIWDGKIGDDNAVSESDLRTICSRSGLGCSVLREEYDSILSNYSKKLAKLIELLAKKEVLTKKLVS